MKLALALTLGIIAAPCLAQSNGKVEIFPAASVRAQLARLATEALASGSSGSTLSNRGTHAIKLSERTATGAAEVHAHFDDVMIVIEGSATLLTGGDVINAHTAANGETTGSAILNGATQPIAAGDVVNIPAGTPHQLIIAPGTIYSALVIKVKE
jgi:mannose-6-phosphate isomerase-like protein (cupin superfamily)